MMKMWLLALLALCLTGCGEAEVFETVDDGTVLPVLAQPREASVTLPEDTVLPVMETDNSTLYMCRDFDVQVQTLDGGDLDATLRQVTGQGAEDLTVITTEAGEFACYEFVWTAAGEAGEQVCRGQILDDGNYHYVLTAMTDAELVYEYQEIWNGMFESFALS